jgi:hypothetical protein
MFPSPPPPPADAARAVDHDDVNPVRPDYAEVFMPPVDLSFSR